MTRLADLTLLAPGHDITMHPWTAELVTRNTPGDLAAEHERALAMRYRRFEQDRGSYEDLVDIPRHLAALGRYDEAADIAAQAAEVLPGTLALSAYLAEVRPLIPPAERAWVIVADLEVQALLQAGDLPAATRQLQAIHHQVQARAAADPANTDWQRDLSVSHEQAGGRGGRGRGPGRGPDRLPGGPGHPAGWPPPTRQHRLAARPVRQPRTSWGTWRWRPGTWPRPATAYQAALDIARPAGRRRPGQHRLAARPVRQPRTSWGTWRWRPGTWPRPATAYQAALDIRVRLAAADPANTDWQRDLSVSHNKLGDVAVAAGDLAAARTAYQAALDIADRLAAADPANTEWQRDLSVSHNKLGDVAIAAGDLAAARDRLPGRPGHRRPAGRRRPGQHRMAARPVRQPRTMGDVAVAAGDLAAARAAYQASLDITARLAAGDPTNTDWQRELSVSHEKLGDVAVAAGDLAAARTAYQAALDIRVRLAAADPANTGWQRDLSVSHSKLGDVAVAAGDLPAARTAYQVSLDIWVRMAAADPANTGWQRDLERIRQKISSLDG